jgi:hypothetical protein
MQRRSCSVVTSFFGFFVIHIDTFDTPSTWQILHQSGGGTKAVTVIFGEFGCVPQKSDKNPNESSVAAHHSHLPPPCDSSSKVSDLNKKGFIPFGEHVIWRTKGTPGDRQRSAQITSFSACEWPRASRNSSCDGNSERKTLKKNECDLWVVA